MERKTLGTPNLIYPAPFPLSLSPRDPPVIDRGIPFLSLLSLTSPPSPALAINGAPPIGLAREPLLLAAENQLERLGREETRRLGRLLAQRGGATSAEHPSRVPSPSSCPRLALIPDELPTTPQVLPNQLQARDDPRVLRNFSRRRTF